ncbi:MFS transporter [Nocardia sp. BMG111209]|uniref:MFS transporter n=1 Tax=Nocardia sp. BMG111209 TaxID=1160137 RepID=UPI0007C5A398|nr:MFS transporter [Nocardia sp. BMG111209]
MTVTKGFSVDISPVSIRAGRREWLGLAVLALPILLISVDFSVLNLALPRLTADLSPSATQQLWILDIYGFMTAGFLVTMGTLGDRIGRRRLLLAGAVAFGAGSVLAACSTGSTMLILARALMGIAGATLAPSGLALIRVMFADPAQRAAAVGVFTGCFTVGAITGPIVGGVMLAHFRWGSVFLPAVPVMLLLSVAGPLLLPEDRDSDAGRLDVPSVALSLVTVLPVIYGITELALDRGQPRAWAGIGVGLVAGLVFARRQRRLAAPLLEPGLFADRVFRGAFTMSAVVGAVQGGTILMINLQLQLVLGCSTLRAGLWMIPSAAAMLVTIGLGPALARIVRPAYIIAAGLAVAAAGYVIVTVVPADAGPPLLITGFALAMAGIGPGTALGYDLVLGAVPPERAGSAAGTAETGGQFGVAAGVAILGSVGAAVYRGHVRIPAGVPPEQAGPAHAAISGAVTATRRLPEALGSQVLSSAHAAFTTGLHVVTALGASALAALAVLAFMEFRHIPPHGTRTDDHAAQQSPR